MPYVKDEGSNLATYAQALKAIVFCVDLDTTKPFDGYCFGHALLKVCQYATSNEVARGLSYASIQKCITWPKKSRKG